MSIINVMIDIVTIAHINKYGIDFMGITMAGK